VQKPVATADAGRMREALTNASLEEDFLPQQTTVVLKELKRIVEKLADITAANLATYCYTIQKLLLETRKKN